MKLSLKNRLVLIGILPKVSDFITLTIKGDLFEKIKMTQDDIKRADIKTSATGVSWNVEKEFDIEIEVTELEHELVKNVLKKLDEDKELTDDTVALYKLFI